VRLKELLRQGRLVRVFALGQLCSPKLVEMVGLQGGYDAVWLDQEHAGLSTAQIEDAARAARAVGLDSFVRLAPTDYAAVMRPLEAGAGGVMAAQVRSARQAEEVLQWAKFQPRGLRGVNGSGVDGRYGSLTLAEYLARANAETFVAIQIEHADALAEVEQIAALPDVDVLFIGPADLSQSLRLSGEWDHPVIWQAIERVAAAARRHGVHWAILPPTLDYGRRCVELGCRMLSLGLDAWAFWKGLRATREDYAEFFGRSPAGGPA
jgi:2-dehydro-3-deoxyglucarate aldolase/4-hydroxy-2-oxoheptanedioate aldolase